MAVVRKLPARVIQVTAHGENVRQYALCPEKRLPRFKPGQFLHLALDPYDPSKGWPESRVFSIARAPTRPEEIRLVISRQGDFTQRILQDVREGDTVWLKLPYGRFVFHETGRPLVLVAGGTGMAPFASLLESCLDTTPQRHIHLHYGVRDELALVFRDLVSECSRVMPNFKHRVYVESDECQDAVQGVPDIGEIYSSTDSMVPDYYLSGPWGMVSAFKAALVELGTDPERVLVDAWE